MTHTGINAQGVQRVRDHLARLPRPDREAQKALASWLHSQGVSLEPDAIDVVTLHLQPQASGRYHAQIVQRTRLPQAVLINWQGESANDFFGALMAAPWAGHFPTDGAIDVVEALDPLPPLSNSSPYVVFNGLFQRCEPARFDTSTLIDIPAESLQRHIESLDFHTRYKKQLEHYWQAHLDEYRLCSKLNVVAACNKQVAEGSLGEAARRLVWQATDLLARSPTFQARWLNIYGYVSTDLLCLHDTHSDLTVLYVPGNSAPLLEFASQDLLRDWVGEQCKDALKRRHLKRHFRLADGPQGVDFSGLDTAMEGLGVYPRRHRLPPEHGFFNDDGKWPPRTYVQYRPDTYSPALEGDLFQALAERQRQRSLDDADFLITSTGEVRERRWRHYLTNTLNLLLPLSFVVPGLAPLLAVGGIVQLGVGLDEAINGKTLHDKLDGIGDITYGLFNAVPGLASVTREADGLFQTWREGFVVPTRLDGQIGYPLSPLDPPHWPEVDIAPFFDRPLRIEPLVDGDPSVAKAISRYPRYDGRNDILRGYYEPAPGYLDTLELVYDMQTNLFLLEDELNEVEPQYYEPDLGTGNLRKTSTANREVTDAMRTATLRALGIDLPLPVELPPPVPEGATPLLKQITALWVGDKQLEAPVLENLAHNARALTDSAYRYRLMLSRRSTEVFAYNLAQLERQVPGLEVLVLEDQDFYRSFEQSPNYAHYQAALGDGGQTSNYASAADVLRYPMLHSEGGIYMDVDDTLVLDPDTGKAALAEVELAVTPEGLLLQPPVQNDLMGLDSAYNNSMIGSHAGNPTLLAVSQEMHARYLATVEPYPLRPDRLADPAAFKHYARQVSRLTGPGLFTNVIDRTLPDLYRLRQLEHLYMIPRINSYQFIDLDEVNALRTARFPLARLAQIGRLHSWA